MAKLEKVPHLRQEKRKKNTNRQLLGLMLLFFLVVLLVLFFRSSMSRVQDISVTGTEIVKADEVVQQSQIKLNMQYLFVDTDKVAASIKNSIPAIDIVRVEKSFPGKVRIIVKEKPRVALWMDGRGTLYPVTAMGDILKEYANPSDSVDKPIIRQWQAAALLPKFAAELAKMDQGIRQQISEISHQPSASDPERIILFMKDGYEVHTTVTDFARNMAWYPSFVQSLKREGRVEGIINLSEVKWFEPYKQQQQKQGESDKKS